MTNEERRDFLYDKLETLKQLAQSKQDKYDCRWLVNNRWGTSWEKEPSDIQIITFLQGDYIHTISPRHFFDDMNEFYKYLIKL